MVNDELELTEDLRPHRRAMRRFLTLLAVLLLAGGVIGWLVWSGTLDKLLPGGGPDAVAAREANEREEVPPAATGLAAVPADAVSSAQTRVAELEARMAQMNLQANATTSQALRAENLLTAMASRRALERGKPLGYLENQISLRFGSTQSAAVQTLLAASRLPVTLDALLVELDGLSNAADNPSSSTGSENGWARLRRELGDMFVVRRQETAAIPSHDRVMRAKSALLTGRIDTAIMQVAAIQGDAAKSWTAKAQRYAAMQAALDTIEEAALVGLPSVIAPPPVVPLAPQATEQAPTEAPAKVS